ncbi:RNA ligase 1 [Engraulis encrasicolus]|uniref:RNA ligase 1 n=1 Tax=Engraulis encrasicolus TaxID=184585 RepID=UPI002FD44C2A
MRRLGTVQQKISCVFRTEVQDKPSGKREAQPFHVAATENLNLSALESDIHSAVATEKLDGTCCYISKYKGKQFLWARLDRKPNKQADKRWKKFQSSQKTSTGFMWNLKEDFKDVPDNWIPAHSVPHIDGCPVPDDHGHILGWVPVEWNSKQYCWHSSVVDYEIELALVLQPDREDEDMLEITCVPLSELQDQTLELIGTNINGNPYGLGSKKQPLHFLVPHGAIHVRDALPVNYTQLHTWLSEADRGKVEGIVWHCNNGALFKLHRHHVNLKWPCGKPFLNTRPVVIRFDGHREQLDGSCQGMFSAFSKLHGQTFQSLEDILFDD